MNQAQQKSVNDQYKKKIIELDLKVQNQVSENKRLQSQIKQKTTQLDRWRTKAQSNQSKIAQIIKNQTKNDKQNEEAIFQLSLSRTSWKISTRAIQAASSELIEDQSSQESNLEQRDQVTDTTKKELAIMRDQYQKLLKEMEVKNAQVSEKSQKIILLQELTTKLKTNQSLQKTDPNVNFNLKLDVLESSKQDELKQIQKQKQEIQNLKNKLNECSERESKLQKANISLQSKKKDIESKLYQKQKELSSKIDQYETLQFESSQRKVNIRKLQAEIRHKKQEIQDILKQKRLESQQHQQQYKLVEYLNQQTDALRKTITNIEATVVLSQKQNDKMRQKGIKMQREIVTVREELFKKQNKLKSALRILEQTKQQLDKQRKQLKAIKQKSNESKIFALNFISGIEKRLKSKDTQIAIMKEMVKSSEFQLRAKQRQVKRLKQRKSPTVSSVSRKLPPDSLYNKQGDMGHSDSSSDMFPQIRNFHQHKQSTPSISNPSNYKHPSNKVQALPQFQQSKKNIANIKKGGKKINPKNNPNSLIDLDVLQRPTPQYPSNNPLLNDMSSLNAVTLPKGFTQDFPSTGGMIRTGISNNAQTVPPQFQHNYYGKKSKSPQMFNSPSETGGVNQQARAIISPNNLNQQLSAASQSPPQYKIPDTIEQIRETPTQGIDLNTEDAIEEPKSSILQPSGINTKKQSIVKGLNDHANKKSIDLIQDEAKRTQHASIQSIPQSMVSKVMKSQIMQEREQQEDEQGNRVKVEYQESMDVPLEEDGEKISKIGADDF